MPHARGGGQRLAADECEARSQQMLQQAEGGRPMADIDLAGKYRESILKALGSADAEAGEQA